MSEPVAEGKRPRREPWELDSRDLQRLDRSLYVHRPGSLSSRLREMDEILYRRVPSTVEVLLPSEVWDFWVNWGRQRIRNGQDVIVVIDADPRISGSRTRIGKSTLGMRLLKEWDPTFSARTLRDRYTTSPSELARFELACRPGQGVLDDEGSWFSRGRDAMTPENKLFTEVLATLASRQAIVVICCTSMLSLDPDVKALTSLRLLVRERGRAEAHVPTVYFDLERPRLLPFREHEMSPIYWEPLRGALWEAYEPIKREAQDRRMEKKLHEQAVFEARRLGLSPKEANALISAGGPVGEGGAGAAEPVEHRCGRCGRLFDNAHNLQTHEIGCAG